MVIDNKKIMPILVISIIVFFHGIDVFTSYEVDETFLLMLEGVLVPFGLGGLVRAGHKTYVQGKATMNQKIYQPVDKVTQKPITERMQDLEIVKSSLETSINEEQLEHQLGQALVELETLRKYKANHP